MLPCICIAVIVINRAHTRDLFILSKVIKAASDAAAPNSNPIAKVTANQYGLDNSKKSITWIVDTTLTKMYSDTKVPIIKPLIILLLFMLFSFLIHRLNARSHFGVEHLTFFYLFLESFSFQLLNLQFSSLI